MKNRSLVLVTLFTLLVTSFAVAKAGWFEPSTTAHRQSSNRPRARSQDLLASDALARWRRCQPTHWRACMLQH